MPSLPPSPSLTTLTPVIFKRVGDSRPYPDHSYVQKQWAAIAPHQVRLDQLVTTKRTLDLEALREWLASRLAKYKVPKHFHVVDALPRNAGGKVQKNVLRERFAPVEA